MRAARLKALTALGNPWRYQPLTGPENSRKTAATDAQRRNEAVLGAVVLVWVLPRTVPDLVGPFHGNTSSFSVHQSVRTDASTLCRW